MIICMNRVVSWLGQKSRIVMLSLLMASMFVILMPVNSSAVLDFGPKVTQEVCGLNGGSMDSDKNTCVFTSKNNTTEQDISDFRSACQDKLKGVYSATTSLGGDQYSNKLNVTCTVALSVDTSLPKIDALIPKLCSPDRQTNGPVGGNQATYADCSQEVRRIYIKCNPAQTATDEDVAKCITDAIKDNSLITIRPNANDLSSSLANADQKTCGSKGDGFVWNADTKTCDAKPAAGDNKDQASCQTQAQGFGWILCPGMSMLSGAINSAVGFVSGGMEWNLLINSGDNNKSASESIREAWNGIRSVANIAFAIVFMIIIYSTATSTGISNYSIKKILPRLIIIAVGMNISFEICAAMADLSNIAGKGLYDLITSFMVGQQSVSWIEGAAREIAAGGVAIGLIIVGLIAWSATLIGLITIVAAIAMRSVLLTMLVIFSPLAFVAALLPNTEKWWKKWRDTYIQLLIVYPAFMSVWAICQLVANISAQTQEWGWIVATLCVIAPIFVIIPLFKASGGFMGKMTGWAQKGIGAAGGNKIRQVNKGQRGRIGNNVSYGLKNFGDGRSLLSRTVRRTAQHGAVLKQRDQSRERRSGEQFTDYLAQRGQEDEAFAATVIAGGKAGNPDDVRKGLAVVSGIQDEQYEKEVKEAISSLSSITTWQGGKERGLSEGEKLKIALGETKSMNVTDKNGNVRKIEFGDKDRTAAIRTTSYSESDARKLADATSTVANATMRKEMAQQVIKKGLPEIQGPVIGKLEDGSYAESRTTTTGITTSDGGRNGAAQQNLIEGRYKAESFAPSGAGSYTVLKNAYEHASQAEANAAAAWSTATSPEDKAERWKEYQAASDRLTPMVKNIRALRDSINESDDLRARSRENSDKAAVMDWMSKL